MASELDRFFKFEIGAMVQHVGADAQYLTTKQSAPTPLVVLERQLQECPGGVQVHYRVRGHNLCEAPNLLEHELMLFPSREAFAKRAAEREEMEAVAWGARMEMRAALRKAKEPPAG